MHSCVMVSAKRIREAREALGESQAVFGSRFGVDQSTVHRWETDGPPTRGPGRMAIEQIVNELHQPQEGAR